MIVRVEFEIELPDVEHTEEELADFLRFDLGDNSMLNGGNPFREASAICEPIFGTFSWSQVDG